MAKNKQMRKRSAKADLIQEMDQEEAPQDVASLQKRARQLKRSVHRLNVELAADRFRHERKMTYAQAAASRRQFMVQAAEFLITAVLFVGACAWLYQWWLSRQP